VLWQAEIDEACRRVLRRHYPKAKLYEDVRDVDERAERVDIVCGGFPCQPASVAGRRGGDADERWLWPEFARVIRSVGPGVVFIENVPGLLTVDGRPGGRALDGSTNEPVRGGAFGRVLADLADLGFDAEWTCIRASDIGAPHRRERLFILAYADRERVRKLYWRSIWARGRCQAELADDCEAVADANGARCERTGDDRSPGTRRGRAAERGGRDVANPDGSRRQRSGLLDGERSSLGDDAHRCDCPRCYVHRFPPGPDQIAEWDGPQPAVRREPHGCAGGLRRRDSLRMLGNSVVPQEAALAWYALTAEVIR